MYKSCIKEIFELAVDDGVLNYNPALSIKLKSDEREDIQYYTKDEVQKLLSVASGILIIFLYLEILMMLHCFVHSGVMFV